MPVCHSVTYQMIWQKSCQNITHVNGTQTWFRSLTWILSCQKLISWSQTWNRHRRPLHFWTTPWLRSWNCYVMRGAGHAVYRTDQQTESWIKYRNSSQGNAWGKCLRIKDQQLILETTAQQLQFTSFLYLVLFIFAYFTAITWLPVADPDGVQGVRWNHLTAPAPIF